MKEKIKLIEDDKGITAYDCDGVFYIELKKGSSVSNHTHKHSEKIFLLKGTAELILGHKKYKLEAPVKITIPENEYHKFTALTDCIGIEVI